MRSTIDETDVPDDAVVFEVRLRSGESGEAVTSGPILASRELLEDEEFDVSDWLGPYALHRIARLTENEGTSGDYWDGLGSWG